MSGRYVMIVDIECTGSVRYFDDVKSMFVCNPYTTREYVRSLDDTVKKVFMSSLDDLVNYELARPIELGYIIVDWLTKEVILEKSFLIKGCHVPKNLYSVKDYTMITDSELPANGTGPSMSKFNGITPELIEEQGMDRTEVFLEFIEDLKKAQLFAAQKVYFDYCIIFAELTTLGIDTTTLSETPLFCSSKNGARYMHKALNNLDKFDDLNGLDQSAKREAFEKRVQLQIKQKCPTYDIAQRTASGSSNSSNSSSTSLSSNGRNNMVTQVWPFPHISLDALTTICSASYDSNKAHRSMADVHMTFECLKRIFAKETDLSLFKE